MEEEVIARYQITTILVVILALIIEIEMVPLDQSPITIKMNKPA